MDWHVLRSFGNGGPVVASNALRAIGHCAVCPVVVENRKVSRHTRKTVPVPRPALPGYLFLLGPAELVHGEDRARIRVKPMMVGGAAARLRNADIKALERLLESPLEQPLPFCVGDLVRVFESWVPSDGVATLVEMRDDHAVVRVEMLGAARDITVPYDRLAEAA